MTVVGGKEEKEEKEETSQQSVSVSIHRCEMFIPQKRIVCFILRALHTHSPYFAQSHPCCGFQLDHMSECAIAHSQKCMHRHHLDEMFGGRSRKRWVVENIHLSV